MKKSTFILNILLALGIILLIITFSLNIEQVVKHWEQYYEYSKWETNAYLSEALTDMYSGCLKETFIEVFIGVSAIINLILLLIIDLPLLKTHKQAHSQAKAEKAEADKQAKIQALEQQLEELKKD